MNFQIEKNQNYKAEVELGFVDKFATNEQVAAKFKSVGFTNVVSTGSGKNRTVTGTWSGESKIVELPKQITTVDKV
jgi:hypothetical protein